MRALVQRVSSASVAIDEEVIGAIETGLVVLLGISDRDSEKEAHYIVGKTLGLRVFPDQSGRFDSSVLDIGAELLVISQFTLYGDTRRGRQPSFTEAAPPALAEPLFDRAVSLFAESGLTVRTGRFRAHMVVTIHNDGPVTIMLDSADTERPRRG